MICAKSRFRFVYVGRTIEAQGGREGGDDLRQESIQVRVCWALNVQVSAAYVIQSFVVVHDGHVGVFKQGVDAKNGVVWLDNRSGDLGASPHSEAELGLLAVINGEALQHQAAKSTS